MRRPHRESVVWLRLGYDKGYSWTSRVEYSGTAAASAACGVSWLLEAQIMGLTIIVDILRVPLCVTASSRMVGTELTLTGCKISIRGNEDQRWRVQDGPNASGRRVAKMRQCIAVRPSPAELASYSSEACYE